MTLDKLKKYCQDNKGPDELIVVVGFSQEYAWEQHERTDFNHKVGQAKYLETAARNSENELRAATSRSKTPEDLKNNMLRTGLLIQRRSQELCPVDTGALKASAFTTVQDKLDEVAEAAEQKADQILNRSSKEQK